MKQPLMLVPGLNEFHWNELANVHLDINYCRHRFIQAVNEKVSCQNVSSIADLEQLAKVDELLKAAGDAMESAKTILFNLCYDSEPPSQDI